MFRWARKSLVRSLSMLIFLGSLILVAVVAILVFQHSKTIFYDEAVNKLSAVNSLKKDFLLQMLKENRSDLKHIAASQEVLSAFDDLQHYHDQGGGQPRGAYDIDTRKYQEIYESMDPFFQRSLTLFGLKEIYFACRKHGHIMYTTQKDADLGTNLKEGEYKDSVLARLWSKVAKTRKAQLLDMSNYELAKEPVLLLGTPVWDKKQNMIGILMASLRLAEIKNIMEQNAGLGESGETYLVGEDGLMRSESRFIQESVILKREVDTKAVQKALGQNGHSKGSALIKDYRNNKVVSVYSHVGLEKQLNTNFDWAIITEMDEKEVMNQVKSLERFVVWVGCIAALLTLILGILIARAIVTPLRFLSAKAGELAQGNLKVEIPSSKRIDEVGELVGSFQQMQTSLQRQTRELVQGASTLASSVNQISATVSELSTSSSQTSSSVNEVSTTTEEVRQTAQIAADKAKSMMESAEEMSRISDEGKQSTEQTISGMKRIKEDNDHLAESIMSLSERTQGIGEIIEAVNDLADQSSLLSVNASIEAAKAGEYGKGFAVVAQEVKSLADQSKDATKQVKGLLREIQASTSKAVMAAERAGKAVESGLDLVSRAGESIGILSESVDQSAQNAEQIAASNREQATGMDQVAQAVSSIKDASQQNVESARQLETAAKDLDELAKTMKDLAGQFKV